MTMHVRRVHFTWATDGYRQMTVEEQLAHEGGTVEVWCGQRVTPTEDERIFVDLDSAANRDHPDLACAACRLAAISELAS